MPIKKTSTKPKAVKSAPVKSHTAVNDQLSPEILEAINKQVGKRGKSSLLLYGVIVVLVVALGYMYWQVQNLKKAATTAPTQAAGAQPTPVSVSINQIKKLFANDYMHFGDADRKVLFVEISDPSCPFCHIAGGKNPELSKQSGRFQYVTDGGTYTPPVPEMKKLVDAGKASFVYLFGNGHGNGRLGAEAMYCANEKGKFWEVHDRLMSNDGYDLLNNKVQNNKANAAQLVDFVANEIDSSFLTSCLQSGKYEKMLARDEQVDTTLGFQGTPHFFVNNTAFNGAYDYKNIEPVVTAALNK